MRPPQVDLADYIEEFPLEQLVEHPANPHRANDDAIRARILASGWYGVIVASTDNVVLAGHGRRRALLSLGQTVAPVWRFTGDAAAQLRFLVADNRAFRLGGYEPRMLEELLTIIDDAGMLPNTGYDLRDLQVLARLNNPPERPPGGGTPGGQSKPGPPVSVSGLLDIPTDRAEISKLNKALARWIAETGSDEGFIGDLCRPRPPGPAEEEPSNVVPFQSRRY